MLVSSKVTRSTFQKILYLILSIATITIVYNKLLNYSYNEIWSLFTKKGKDFVKSLQINIVILEALFTTYGRLNITKYGFQYLIGTLKRILLQNRLINKAINLLNTIIKMLEKFML